MGGILTSGNIVLDLLVRPVGEVTWGVTRWVDSIDTSLGGNGANTASAVARLGVPSRLLGRTGGDLFGTQCRQMLAVHGVDLAFVEQGAERTAASIVLIQENGARTFLHRPGSSCDVFAEGLAFTPERTAGMSHYHLANVFALPHLRSQAPAVLAAARAAGLTTSLDTAWDTRNEWLSVLEPCLPCLDLLFVNEDEARMLTGSADPDANAAFFLGRGARQFVMKRGPLGCSVYAGASAWHLPALAVAVIDTTGAGDCFAGAFLAALQKGLALPEAAQVANTVGAMVVEQVGATTGLRSWAETLQRGLTFHSSSKNPASATLPA
jgi:sugar/nucleoside kinase (ribokinase family)